jgi:hypothetical protein
MHALVEIVSDLAAMDEPRKHLAGLISGLDIRYDFGEGHPLLGRRMPDLDLGSMRVYDLLHEARPVLLSFGGPMPADRVRVVEATYSGEWELPVIGTVSAPTAVLVRPDGYVAWVGEGSDAGLSDALTAWFG